VARGELIFWRSHAWDHPDQKALIQILSTACSRMSWSFLALDRMPIPHVKVFRCAQNMVLWNGTTPDARYILNLRRRLGLATLTVEQGWMPQRDHFGFDHNGIAGDSSLCVDSLDWVGEPEYRALDELRDEYWPEDWNPPRRRRHQQNGKILVLGQLMRDSQIVASSDHQTVEDVLLDAEAQFGVDQISFRPHPFDKERDDWRRLCEARGVEFNDPDDSTLIEQIMTCRGTFAINSTGLYETAMMGLPAQAIGDCPLASHSGSEDEVERLLAAMASRQFRKDCEDVIPVLERMNEFEISGGG